MILFINQSTMKTELKTPQFYIQPSMKKRETKFQFFQSSAPFTKTVCQLPSFVLTIHYILFERLGSNENHCTLIS